MKLIDPVDVTNAALMEVGSTPRAFRDSKGRSRIRSTPATRRMDRRAVALGLIAKYGPERLMFCELCSFLRPQPTAGCTTAVDVLRGRNCGRITITKELAS